MILLQEVSHPHDTATYPEGTVAVVCGIRDEGSEIFYDVRLPDGANVTLPANLLMVLKTSKKQNTRLYPEDSEPFDYSPFVIYRCIVGSRAYGLSTEHSDTDRRGIYLPPAERQWSLQGVPEQIENKDSETGSDACYWELQKFITLALKANPNILECLYTPLVETCHPLAEELLAIRQGFLSKLVFQTYNGYVMSQFNKIEQDLRTRGEVRWKHAMHLIRLLLAGITIVREGTVPVDMGEHRALLLSIRQGEVPWPEVVQRRLDLNKIFEEAYRQTSLPDRPDIEQANRLLIRARRSMIT